MTLQAQAAAGLQQAGPTGLRPAAAAACVSPHLSLAVLAAELRTECSTQSGMPSDRNASNCVSCAWIICVIVRPCCAVRLGLNKRVTPQTRDIIFGGAVLMALAHAGYVMSGDSTM